MMVGWVEAWVTVVAVLLGLSSVFVHVFLFLFFFLIRMSESFSLQIPLLWHVLGSCHFNLIPDFPFSPLISPWQNEMISSEKIRELPTIPN